MRTDGSDQRFLVPRVNRLTAGVAAAVGSLVALPFAVSAQDSGEIEVTSDFFEEIKVTATRRTTSIQDIPYNISAIGAQGLRELRIDNVADLARWTPGMILVDQGPRYASPLIMRGVSVSDLTFSESVSNNNGGTVATYIGEIPVYVDLVTKDMERIEMLRGPQGTLYGAGSLAGAVRYIPNKPNLESFTTDLHARGYSIDESDSGSYDIDGTVNWPIVRDTLAFRGTLSYTDNSGFIDQSYLVQRPGFSVPEPDFSNPADVNANLQGTQKDVNGFETLYGRAALLWQLNDRWNTTLTYHYQNQDVDGRQVNHQDSLQVIEDTQGVDIPNGFYDNGHRVAEPMERTNQIFEWTVVGDMGFAELTTALGYSDYDENGQRDQTDLLLTFGYTYADFPTFTAFTSETQEDNTLSLEARLVSPDDSPLNWIGGLFYQNYESDRLSLEYTPCMYDTDPTCPPGGSGVPEIPGIVDRFGSDVEYIQDVSQETEEWAVFGEISYYFTDAWQVTLGGRYTNVDDKFAQGIGLPLLNQILDTFDPDFDGSDPNQQIAFNPTSGDADFDDFFFKANTSYDFTEDLMAYFTFSQGYRNGGSNAILPCANLPPSPNVVCGTPDQLAYDPDTSDNWEVGLRSQWWDNRITANAALYFIQWDKVQLSDFSASGALPITTNGQEAESKGVELELAWALTQHMNLRGAYAYTNAELSKDAPLLAGGTAQPGDRLPGTPEHQGSLFLDGMWPINSSMELGGSLGFTSQSDVLTKLGIGSSGCCRPDDGSGVPFSLPGPGEELPGFTVWYAAINLSGDRWDLSLYADNLFDKEAVTGVRADQSFIGRAGGASDYAYRRYFNYVLTPRVIGLDFRYKFN